ncbi:MAG: CinA family nicotinamide mononucleotide deamidase-related protein [Bacteroidota bacterium]
MSNLRASIITIGDELLIGQTIDTNSAWIAQRLNELGIDVVRRIAVGDNADMIKNALDDELLNASIVLITGGLGPTADDITKPLLCKYFGGKLIVNEKVLAHVIQLFEKRKRPFLERNMKQAEVPDNCIALHNRMGTAPGMLFLKEGKYIIAMPGVPFEMMTIMEDEVLPRLKEHFISDAIVHRSIMTSGEGESFIAEKLQDLEEALPEHIKLAFLPHYGGVKLRLTGRGSDKAALEKELEQLSRVFVQRLGTIVVALEDVPLQQLIGAELVKMKATIGLAESCTGGYIAHHITQVMGSSRYFRGSLVCYQNDIKENVLGVQHNTILTHGAISEATAIEMAVGARKVLGSDYAFSITGLLSAGGDDDSVPVGTVWMAVVNLDTVKTKEFKFHFDRERNKELATQMAMLMIWKFLNNKL